jgi:hypothetical protein
MNVSKNFSHISMLLTCLFQDTEYNAGVSIEVTLDGHGDVPEQRDHMGLHGPW